MSVGIKTIGYKYRVSKDTETIDIINTTELGIAESNRIIREFFDNFKILKSYKVTKPIEAESNKIKPSRKIGGAIKDVWGNVRDLLNDEFVASEYITALKDAGYEYTKDSMDTVPFKHLRKLIKLGKIELIEGSKPRKYLKIKMRLSESSNDKFVKDLKEGELVLMGTIK